MKITCLILMLSSLIYAQDVVLDLKVYAGSYDAKEAGSVVISLPEGQLTPSYGLSVAEEIQRTFHLKTLELVSAPRIVTPVGQAATIASEAPEGTPIRSIRVNFKPVSVNKDTAHISLQFSANGKEPSGAEMMVRPGQPFTLSSRLNGHLAFLICTLQIMEQKGETPPRVIKKEGPAFPEDLREARVQGMVVMKLHIDEKGKVLKCEKAKADDDRFVAPACEAAMKWEFEPARKDGKPIAYDYFVTMSFRLD
jgi:TonB family protein